jgi:hypothetical protein
MKKAIMFALALVAMLSISAMATDTRTLVMGNNNNIMLDDANVGLYPSRIVNYPNLAIGELTDQLSGSDMLYRVGVNWKFGEEKPWVLGTYFSTVGDFLPIDYYGDYMMDWDELGYLRDYYYWYPEAAAKANQLAYMPSSRSFDLIYGRTMGAYNFGFSLGYNHSSFKSETAGNDFNESFTVFEIGLGLTPVAGNWDVAAKISMGSWTDENSAGVTESEPDGYSDISLMGRYFHKMNNIVTLVPHAGVSFGSRGADWNDTIYGGFPDYKQTRSLIELGCGMNYTPVTNVLAVLDFGIQMESLKDEEDTSATAGIEYKETWTNFPYFRVGVEGEVFSWLDARMGVTSEWANYKYEDNFKAADIVNQTYLGVGLNFNRLHIDTYMDPEIVLDGFNFVSGSDDADDLNFQVSLLYEMF